MEREGTWTKNCSKSEEFKKVFQRLGLGGVSAWDGNPGPCGVGVNSMLGSVGCVQ